MKSRKCIKLKLWLTVLGAVLATVRGEDCGGCVLRDAILDCYSVTRPGDFPWPLCSSSNKTVAASFKDSDIKNLGRFPYLKAVERVSLSHNDMESIQDGAFEGLPSLTHLDLSHNRLEVEDISPTVLRGPYSPKSYEPMALESLNLGWNLLHSLDAKAFEHCVALRELRMDGNPLRIIDSNTVRALSSQPIQILSLSGTRLSDLPHALFENLGSLRSLRVLSLSSNNLTSVPRGLALVGETLEELILSRNLVEVVDDASLEGTWPRLHVVDLSAMPLLRRLGPRALSALTQLRDLQCHGNPRLAEVHQHALQGLHHIRRIRLDENDLRQLDLEVSWKRLEVLYLSRNPWQCDCSSLQWFQAAAPYVTDNPRCLQPASLAGMDLRSMNTTLLCAPKPPRASRRHLHAGVAAIIAIAVAASIVGTLAFLVLRARKSRKTGARVQMDTAVRYSQIATLFP